MEMEAVLKLFDSCWFEHLILKKQSASSTSTSFVENKDYQIKVSSEESKLARIRTSHNRSMSDQSLTSFNHDSLSPDSVLLHPKLQTILSGKEVTDSDSEAETPPQVPCSEKKRRGSKSLSELEFEELKGFMDLGFVFSEEDKDSSLASIIPGLQRLGKKEEEQDDSDDSVVPRPYLSEAWEVYDRRKKENPLMNWKVPALNNEIDMKDSLRWWAHTVASTVIS